MDHRSIASQVREESMKAKSSLTGEKLFRSYEYAEHTNNIVRTITDSYRSEGKTPISVDLYWSDDENDTACTNGTHIRQNLHCRYVHNFSNLYSQYLAQIGMTLHECSHILYCNFREDRKAVELMKHGQFPSKEPEIRTNEDEMTMEEIKQALQEEPVRKIFAYALSQIQNISSDAHDEDCLIDDNGQFVSDAISTIRYSLWSECMMHPLEEKLEAFQAKKISRLELMFDCMLQFIRFHEVAVSNEDAYKTYEPIQVLSSVSRYVSALRYTDDVTDRNYFHNEILFQLWPYIREEIENQKTTGNVSGTSSMEKIAQAITDILASAVLSSGAATPHVTAGKNSPTATQRAKNAVKMKKDPSQQGLDHSKSSSCSAKGSVQTEENSGFAVLVQQFCDASGEAEVQNQIQNATNVIIQSTPATSSHVGITIHTPKIGDIHPKDIEAYEKIMKELRPYSRKIQREMEQLLQDLRDGGLFRHRISGKIFEAKEAYRPDQRYFAKKTLPENPPELALSILVDHSGSMEGERIATSMKAAILLHDFGVAMGIPVCVAGHNCDTSKSIAYFSYTDFDSASPKEKYRLAKMKTSGCNRDGLALETALNLLSKREEETRLLFIISDGQPSANDYHGEPAYQDMREIVGRYRKMGIQTIAAAIGEDKERIKQIYGREAFLDISDLQQLPKVLINVLRKQMMP